MPSGEPFANLFRCPVQTAAAAPGRSLIFTHHTLEDKHLRVAFFFPSPTDASPTDEHQLWPVSAHKDVPICALPVCIVYADEEVIKNNRWIKITSKK